jgi:hypothetical protein
MDQISLVDRRIDDGQELLLQLAQDGFEVTAAFWLKTAEENWWHLYLASKRVDQDGPAEAYRALQTSLRRLPGTTISLADVKLISASHPLARDVIAVQKRYPGRAASLYHGAQLGGVAVEEAYIYAPLSRQKQNPYALGERRLKTAVEQTTRLDEVLAPLSPQESKALEQIVASGVSPAQAELWVRKKRELERPRPAIPAGSIVRAWVTAWWGDRPEDDPNPLLEVEAPDGARGLTFKNNTEPV